MDDKELLKLHRCGFDEGLDDLIDKYGSSIYNLCFRLTSKRDEAEDLFQDTWLKVVKNIDSFDIERDFKAWLISICVNSYRDKYRKRKRWLNIIKDFFTNEDKEAQFEKIECNENNPEELITVRDEIDRLYNNLNKIDDKQKLPIILYYFENNSYKEISEILKIPEGTVKSRINTGKKKLKELMGGVDNG